MIPIYLGGVWFSKLLSIELKTEGGFNKENYRPLYKIVSSDEITTGIDWDTGLISTKKLDLKVQKLGKTFIWQMEWIIQIVDGRESKLNLKQLTENLGSEMKQFAIESYGNFNADLYK